MGSIRYDGLTTHFDDRLLTHLQIIIVQKLMREESFLMSWKDSMSTGDGRTAIWLSPQTTITFKFVGSRVPEINKKWLLRLGESASSTTGLIVTGEDGELAAAEATGSKYPGNLRPGN
ncbi:ATP-dependent DNA ligase [Leucobacter manosquensis]|uniref:ATP-dependent DNA ligase n=1 Tax=Leucobacter manosquensis TaxID=2810611 RepID=A0ABS5M2G6_9MICO|nr:ATP-dependent DNA ligase [Leucobacter manosquensis]MBS3181393.1 ATP-dependent DNA ligase [Leucobacter manosquensis]